MPRNIIFTPVSRPAQPAPVVQLTLAPKVILASAAPVSSCMGSR